MNTRITLKTLQAVTDDRLQIQIWNTQTRAYENTGDTAAPVELTSNSGLGPLRKGTAIVAKARSLGKAWRIVKDSRPLKPKHTTPRYTASDRSIIDVQREYLRWAEARGLKSITAYSHKYTPPFFGTVAHISVEDHFNVDSEVLA